MTVKMIQCPAPDHPDLNPSAMIDTVSHRWKCLGCGASGHLEVASTRNVETIADKFISHYDVMRSDDYEDEQALVTAVFEVMIGNGDIMEGACAAQAMEEQLKAMREKPQSSS